MAYDLSPFGTPTAGRSSRWVAGGTTVAFHVALAIFFLLNPDARQASEQWVEMVVQKTEPPPPPPPEPEPPPPEPEPERPKPKPVAFKDIPKTPPPDVPPPEAPADTPPPTRAVRRVQGLSANSFATGAGTGVSVRAGGGVDLAAGKETATIEDAAAPRSYAAVTRAPKPKSRPNMEVPAEARKAEVQGVVKVQLTIGADGRVKTVKVLSDIGFGTGDACADAWKKASFVPGEQNGQPVEVTGYPEKCTVSIVE